METLLVPLIAGLVCLSFGSAVAAAQDGESSPRGAPHGLLVADKGVSAFRIVIAKAAPPAEKRAANELQMFLERICGARLPIITDDQPPAGREIILGDNAHLRQLGLDVDFTALGDEGFVIRTLSQPGAHSAGSGQAAVPQALVIAGGRPRGTLYGVYTFLDEQLGCRWFTANVSRIPRRERIALPDINQRVIPRFIYREPFWYEGLGADWAARNRMNSSAAALTEEHGGKITYYPFVHSFYLIIPPEKYFAAHPEWFSEINGKRTAERAQLCLTNEEMTQEAIRTVKGWIRDHPEAKIFSVSQNDCKGWCECAACRAVDEREESHAGAILHFVNRIADAIAAEYPNVLIDTLAYQYGRKPPKAIRPAPNVVIRLCSIECCFSHPLDGCDSEKNRAFMRDLRGWDAICGGRQLFIWDYTTNFANCPQPFCNIKSLAPNIRTFADNGVIGVFEQGWHPSPSAEFGALKAYLMARFLWKPDADFDAELTEYLKGVYGPAAPAIRSYIDLLCDNAIRNNLHAHIVDSTEAPYLAPDIVARAGQILEQAGRLAADDEQVVRQVEAVERQVLYLQVHNSKPAWRLVGDQFTPDPTAVPGHSAALKRFVELSNALGAVGVAEGQPWEQWLEAHRLAEAPMPAIRAGNDALDLTFVPALGGRLISLVDRKSGLDIVAAPRYADQEYPACNGYWDRIGSDRLGPTANERYQADKRVTERGEEVTLTRDYDGGLRLERTILVPAGDERSIVVTSRLINAGSAPVKAILQTHPELRLGEFEDCALKAELANGERIDDAFPNHPQGKPWGYDLLNDRVPAGSWSVVNQRLGMTVTVEFEPGQVARAQAKLRGDWREVELILYSPEREIAPGEAIAMTHRWRIQGG